MASALSRRLAVARGDEPADLVVRGGQRVLGLHARVARDGRRGRRRLRRRPRRLRGRARRSTRPAATSCPASSTRTCTSSRRSCSSTSSRGSCCRSGRPPSSPTRTRSRTCSAPTACTGCSTSASGIPLDVWFMASSCVPASQFESPRRELTPGDLDALLRRRRVLGLAEMMNFPGVDRRRRARAREARARPARRRPRARRARPRAERLRRRRHPLRPRGVHRRGGPRAAARRHVAADPRGVGGAQPPRAAAAARRVRARPDRLLHRRPRAGAHRRRRPHQLDGARRGRVRDPARGRARLRDAQPGALARPRRTSARSRPATRPTCCCCPTSSGSCPELGAEGGRPVAEIPRAEVPDWVRHTVRIGALGPGDVPHPVAAAAGRA